MTSGAIRCPVRLSSCMFRHKVTQVGIPDINGAPSRTVRIPAEVSIARSEGYLLPDIRHFFLAGRVNPDPGDFKIYI